RLRTPPPPPVPYTTLFRSVYHWIVLRGDAAARPPKPATAPAIAKVAVIAAPSATEPAQATEALEPHGWRYTQIVTDATEDDVHRSEEHTSELQSRFDLVCR